MAKRAKKSTEPTDIMDAADKALAKLPSQTNDRLALFIQADRLKADQQSAAGELSQHRKRMTERFGLTKAAIRIRDILAKATDNDYAATVSQLQLLLDDINRPLQLDMFVNGPKPPPPVEEPDEPIEPDEPEEDFEEPIGAVAEVAELPPKRRRGRPPKVKTETDLTEKPIANRNKHLKRATPALPLDVAQSEFEKARILAEKKRGPAAAVKAGAAESDEFLAKQVTKQRKPPAAPPPSNDDTFLDDSDPDRQGSYELQ